MTDTDILQEINQNIKKLLGIMATQGMSDEKKIKALQSMNFNSREITEITGIPEATVRAKWSRKSK